MSIVEIVRNWLRTPASKNTVTASSSEGTEKFNSFLAEWERKLALQQMEEMQAEPWPNGGFGG